MFQRVVCVIVALSVVTHQGNRAAKAQSDSNMSPESQMARRYDAYQATIRALHASIAENRDAPDKVLELKAATAHETQKLVNELTARLETLGNDSAAVSAIALLMRLSTDAPSRARWRQQLIDNHLHDPALIRAMVVFQKDGTLKQLIDDSNSEVVRAVASYHEIARQATLPNSKIDFEFAIDKVKRDFGDVMMTDWSGEPIETLGETLDRERAQLMISQVGSTVPDFEGTDPHGVEMKFSDFRGKTVVLWFWGNWCPPCRVILPHMQELVERHKDQPFAIVGVNTDSRENVLATIEREKITWPTFADDSTRGPITQVWRIRGFPAIFVIDAEGTIRYKNVRGKSLEDAVAELLGE